MEGLADKETMADPFPDDGCNTLTAYLTKKTRRRPKIAGQPFRATYDLFLQPECLSDFQSFAGAGWEQTMLVGTVVQCPSKKNGYKFKGDWENDSIPSEWLCREIEGTHWNKALIKQAVVTFANPKPAPNNGKLDSVNMFLTTPSIHDNVDSVPNVLLHMNLPFSPRTQPRNDLHIPNSADRAQALANLRVQIPAEDHFHFVQVTLPIPARIFSMVRQHVEAWIEDTKHPRIVKKSSITSQMMKKPTPKMYY